MSPVFRLRLFGNLRIEVNGKPAEFKRRKSEALIAYLALHEGQHSREKIAADFWGDSSNEDARRTLRVVLTDIRKTLGEDFLIGERNTLALNETLPFEIDARRFKTLLHNPVLASTPELLSALELYRGDLLEDLQEEWLLPLREAYRASALAALNTLAERSRAEGQYSRVVDFAERMLQIDPFYETGVQHLIFSLAAQGEKSQALARFRDIEKLQSIEFSKETLDLVEQIRKQTVSNASRSTNLPRPLTSFIGREDELNEVETLLAKHRLVTLLGAGGSGKTRLAIQAADEIAHNYVNVWWVDLSALTESALVPQVIAKSLGVREQMDKAHLQSVGEMIGEQRMLVVLDNCEQVLNACAQSVGMLLAYCPQLSILATSREPLGVDGEIEWQVPVLPLPTAEMPLKALSRNESIRLFLERGRSANSSFELTANNAGYVTSICRKLDGIPLAIELAATLLRVMTVEDVSKRIDRQFESLHMSDDTRPLRQQTLHALIDWSYKLLTPAEQMFFRRLGVFSGGWSFEAAMSVAGGYGGESLRAEQVGEDHLLPLPINVTDIVYGLLDSLKRRSLITVTHFGGITRYHMLETLREFALERCAAGAELEALYSRHLKTMLHIAEVMNDQLSSGTANQVDLLRQFDPEVDNVRTALSWALREGDVEDGMALGAAVYRYWTARQMYSEIRGWLEKLCAHPQAQKPTRARADALTQYALSLRLDSQRRFTPAITREAAAIFSSLNDERGLALANYAEGETLLNYNEVEPAERPLLDALAYFRVDPQNIQAGSATLAALARIETIRRNFEQAYAYLREALALSENSQADLAKGWSLLTLGDVAFQMDELSLAAEHYKRSLEYYIPLNRLANSAYLQEALAAVAFAQGNYPEALRWADESIASYDTYGAEGTIGRVYRAAAAQALGDLESARHWLIRAFEISTQLDQFSAMCILRLADYACSQKMYATAATLYAYTLHLAQDPSAVFFPPELRDAQAGNEKMRITIPSAEYQAAVDRAGLVTFEAAVRLVFP